MKFLMKIVPALLFWGIFGVVILQVPYPQSITQADFIQLGLFFIPLFLAFLFTSNIFFKKNLISGSLSLGIIFLLILKALGSLNAVTTVLVIASIGFLISYFRKIKGKNLTKLPKIPKLTKLRR